MSAILQWPWSYLIICLAALVGTPLFVFKMARNEGKWRALPKWANAAILVSVFAVSVGAAFLFPLKLFALPILSLWVLVGIACAVVIGGANALFIFLASIVGDKNWENPSLFVRD